MTIDFEDQIKKARRALQRSPNTIKLYFNRFDKRISAEQALHIHDEYGINLRDLMLLIFSHGFETDEGRLIELLEKDQAERDRSVPCKNL